ncbi:hypothetical protein ACH5RR_041132 [Cinchona calisaya]|uniref:Leucine-rich repeat-containing N-terminal plant-type domain-containing protein n=1 Tax=Cinchona calisaya TaxID=153742 RepID=A0ABD2XY34_9GENT
MNFLPHKHYPKKHQLTMFPSEKEKMEVQNPILGFWSSSLENIMLMFLLLVANFLSKNHASAAKHFGNETDRLALLEFRHQIHDDPYGVLNSWNHSQHHCKWQGVTCGRLHQRVTALTISGKSLSGTISPRIGNLSFIKFFHLGINQFHVDIPKRSDACSGYDTLTCQETH